MAAFILTEIYRRTQTTPAECAILQIIGQVANVQGRNARIAYEALAQRSGYTVRYVFTLVKRLEAKGILAVTRSLLRYALNAVNVYTINRPWLKDLTFREALDRRKAQQQQRTSPAPPPKVSTALNRAIFPDEQIVHAEETKERNPNSPAFLDEEILTRRLGLTPGSLAYRLALGLD